MKKQLCLAALCAAMAVPAVADESGFFIVGDIGYVDFRVDNDTTFAFGLGYQFNDNVELEGGHRDFGSVSYFGGKTSHDSKFINVNLGGMLTDSVKLYGILGYERVESEVDSSFVGNYTESSGSAFLGLGLDYELTEGLSTRLRIIAHDGSDVKTATVGLKYRF